MPYLKGKYIKRVESVINTLKERVYEKKADLSAICYHTKEPLPYTRRMEGAKKTIQVGDVWGELFDCAWFCFQGSIPSSCAGQKVVLEIDVNGEGLIFDNDGVPVKGLTCVNSEFDFSLGQPGKKSWVISDAYNGDGKVSVWVDAACNDLFGRLRGNGTLALAQISVCHENIRQVFYDMSVLLSVLKACDEQSAQYNQILFGLYDACLTMQHYDVAEIDTLRGVTQTYLKKGANPYLKFTAIGHAHLDLAWLWPIRESIRKGARTFATALELMQRYPEYRFGASQAQLFQWMKDDYPELYEKVKEKVREGRIEVQGCMWVEADTNIAGGEALVRQILYGKQFFQKEFGIEVKNLWLPDVFGYTAALPQLLKKSGCDYFVTQKLSWSEHNKFPHQTFMWEGIDGSQVFAHMLPDETYNGPMAPERLKFAEHNYMDSGVCDEALMLFGIGDGGGGPGADHLERYRRMKDLSGFSAVENAFAQPMLERLAKKTDGRLQKWKGELYLEKHQGTYTTQANNKKYNRLMELALRELEFAIAFCDVKQYAEKELLDTIWKEVLLYQFHDIIPGSSIKRVYDESAARYETMYAQVLEMIKKVYENVASGATVFNSMSWARAEIVNWDGEECIVNVAPLGASNSFSPAPTEGLCVTEHVIENAYLRVQFDEGGAIVSLYDKQNDREALSGRTNVFSVYEDVRGDCWDISLDYVDKKSETFEITESITKLCGARVVCTQRYRYGNSEIVAEIALSSISRRVDVSLTVDWDEENKMLRTSVVTNVYTDSASFEIQYGKINRANNDNTMWQKAQFEVCAHKWVDLSQDDYGVALLNRSKYGYRVYDNVIDMNLLRSQNYPGRDADIGRHEIAYAIYPHSGNEAHGNVSREAYNMNVPLHVYSGSSVELLTPLASVEGDIVVEAVKPSECGDGIVVRAYEPYGKTTRAQLRFRNTSGEIWEANLIEQKTGTAYAFALVERTFEPFEIVTFIVL